MEKTYQMEMVNVWTVTPLNIPLSGCLLKFENITLVHFFLFFLLNQKLVLVLFVAVVISWLLMLLLLQFDFIMYNYCLLIQSLRISNTIQGEIRN